MKNLDKNPHQKLQRGDKVQYTFNYGFGKTGIETGTVVMVVRHKALLDNGRTVYMPY